MIKSVVKIFIWPLALIACSNESRNMDSLASEDDQPKVQGYADQIVSNNQSVDYLGQFEYELVQCQGPHKDELNGFSKKDFLTIVVNRDRVQLLRKDFKDFMNIKVHGSWNSVNDKLLRMRGYFGITTRKEDWTHAKGSMKLLADSIEGVISDISVVFREDNICLVNLRFAGTAVIEPHVF